MRMIQGLFIGCVVGALLGILFAPKRGEQTRADMQRWMVDQQEQAQQRLAQVLDQATTVLEQGRQRVNIPLDVVRRATGQVFDKAKG